MTDRHAVILCGELSGERYAAALTTELLARGYQVSGMGGALCRDAGMTVVQDYHGISVVGIAEVLENLGSIRAAANRLEEHIRQVRPRMLICIDFPDFNIRLARRTRSHVGRLFYFVPPQVWAWRSYRAKGLSRLFDRIFTLLPFEKPLFENGEFVGHPLAELVKQELAADAFAEHYRLKAPAPTVLLLPGSRKREIATLLPTLTESCRLLSDRCPELQFLLLPGPAMDDSLVSGFRQGTGLPLTVVDADHKYAAMAAADVAVGASGTVTLECGLSELPMAVLYRLHPVSTLVGMLAVTSRFISLPNVLLDEPVYPEMVNRDCHPAAIADWVSGMLDQPGRMSAVRRKLARLRPMLYREQVFRRAVDRMEALS